MEELRFSEFCANCRKKLHDLERVLFVETEVGRCFCTEECIQDYFQPTVEAMEEEWRKLRSPSDFTDKEVEKLLYHRGDTLEDPDEVWIQTAETSEKIYTFISQFRQGEDPFWFVVACITIEGIPSFVFLSFATRDEALVEEYRRGQLASGITEEDAARATEHLNIGDEQNNVHQLAEPGSSSFERLYGDMRQANDIPREDFPKFDPFVDSTLDEPDEIWTITEESSKWYSFISKYKVSDSEIIHAPDRVESEEGDEEEATGEEPGAGVEPGNWFYMVLVCRQVGESLEVVFAFPTIDPGLVQHFRKGIHSLNKTFGVGWARGRAA